jgi:uncharacterized membrane protein YeaQ/YmgE (transglycosylase-associated protein family)
MENTRYRLLIGAEIAGGAVIGIALGMLGMVLGRQLGVDVAPGNGWSDLVGAVTGTGGGYLLGVVAGSTLVSRRYTGQGSFFAALVGGLAGSVLAVAIVRLLDLYQYSLALPILFLLLTPLGAVLALHLSPRHQASTGNASDGRSTVAGHQSDL